MDKTNRIRKLCIFCGRNADSGEHVWPKWSHSMHAKVAGHTQLTFEAPVTKKVMSRTFDRRRQGSVAKVAIKRVCKTCNNGWMSHYEDRCKPMLSAMMQGEKLALAENDQVLLAEYFAFKIMVLDWTAADAVIEAADRNDFFENRTIPKNMQIMIAYCPDPQMGAYYRAHFMEGVNPDRIAAHRPGRNVKTFALGFAGIFVFAICIKDDAIGLELARLPGWFNLHPTPLPNIFWPPLLTIDRIQAERVASSLNTLKNRKNVKLIDSDFPTPEELF